MYVKPIELVINQSSHVRQTFRIVDNNYIKAVMYIKSLELLLIQSSRVRQTFRTDDNSK